MNKNQTFHTFLFRMAAMLCVTAMIMMAFPSKAWADGSWTSGNCTVTLTGGTLTVSGNGAMDDYGGGAVSPWFYDTGCNSSITSIVIGSGVTHIGVNAFYSCGNLGTVTFEATSQQTTIGGGAFSYCNMSSITIPANVTIIGDGAFCGCQYLATVTFEANSHLTTIDENAFLGCIALTAIDIPNSVTTIGDHAFSCCDHLASVNIGSGVTTIGDEVFMASWELANITVDENNANYKSVDGVLFNKTVTKLLRYPPAKTATSYAIPDGVTSIGDDYAFHRCENLTAISLPASLKSIGKYTFYNCFNLETVTIEANSQLTSIGDHAFDGSLKLTAIAIPAGVTTIGAYAFNSCFRMTSVTFDANSQLTTIGAHAFDACNYIETINLEANSHLTTIGDYAFWYCWYLSSITIPASVTSLRAHAFDSCDGITSLNFEANSQLTTIGESVFKNCRGLTSVTIPDGVTTIGKHAFMCGSGAMNLASVTIPASVTCISDSAFYNCSNLETITLLEGSQLATIGMKAFYNSKWLTNHPDGLAYIGNVAYQLKGSTFDGSIREGTVSIADGCFANKSITAVSIPNTVKIIGTRAFEWCSNLTSIVIPASVTCICDSAFYHCTYMTSAVIGSGVETIGAYAFDKCIKLTTIVIGNGVTTIGRSAFTNCRNQRTYTIYATTPPTIFNNIFYNGTSFNTHCKYVLSDCLEVYNSHPYGEWSTLNYAIPDLTVHDAGGELGSWCTYYNGLADVTVPDGTTIYKASLNSAKDGVIMTEVDGHIIKRGEAVLLKSTSDITISSAASSGTGDYTGNVLQGVDISTPQATGITYYVLSKPEGKDFGFYQLADGTDLAANKAYLVIPAAARGFIGLDANNSPTAINDTKGSGTSVSSAVYTLDGRRLQGEPSKKGVYVRNGQKFIIK